MASLLFFIIGLFLGYFTREIRILVHKPYDKPEPPKQSGVALGSYAPRVEKTTAFVVKPKSPARMDWEARERIQKEGLSGLHKPGR
jgi:hypothetical protein